MALVLSPFSRTNVSWCSLFLPFLPLTVATRRQTIYPPALKRHVSSTDNCFVIDDHSRSIDRLYLLVLRWSIVHARDASHGLRHVLHAGNVHRPMSHVVLAVSRVLSKWHHFSAVLVHNGRTVQLPVQLL